MQRSLLDYLVCPTCRGELELRVTEEEAHEVLTGTLRCTGCGREHPIRGGVPRLLPTKLEGPKWDTAKAFGWQWKQFSNLLLWDEQREQFLDWLEPLKPDDFSDKVVLDAGCGMGRLTEVAATFGPRQLIGVDLSSAVEVAWRRLRGRPNVHIVQADITQLPLRTEDAQLDIAYSVGVLHHLPDPRAGFDSIVNHLRPGGKLHGWVYGQEGNAWVEALVSPLRERVTSRIPRNALLGLSYALTVPLHAAANIAANLPLRERLPYTAYLSWLAKYSFGHNLHVVFDHLGPPISHYLSREELHTWFTRDGIQLLSMTARNANSWRFLVERPAVHATTPD